VTGAGHGLGRSYALELASRGAAIVCNDLVGRAAEATAQEIAQHGGVAVPETSSVATSEGGKAIVRTAIDAFGSADILINNVGQLRNAAFDEMSVEDFDQVLQTHLAGAFYVTQPAYRHMKSAGYGRIVFTSSSAGMFGSPWQANYAAAKAGLVGLWDRSTTSFGSSQITCLEAATEAAGCSAHPCPGADPTALARTRSRRSRCDRHRRPG
jgi:NAD(P)-dependent dehydrogenase (short-subunit alcohol dehydrogenase family)